MSSNWSLKWSFKINRKVMRLGCMRLYGSWNNPEIKVFVILLHVFYVRWWKREVCWLRYRFRVFWRAEFRSFEILMIGLMVREIWTKIWVLKKCKGGTLIDFLVKNFFFLSFCLKLWETVRKPLISMFWIISTLLWYSLRL